jgi:PAS domain S-box-containing protein
MRAKIRKYLGPPIFVDSDKTGFATALRTLLMALLVLSPAILIVGLLVNEPKYVWGVIITDVVVVGALGLLRRGFITLVSLLLPLILLVLAMYFVFVGNGLNDTALLMFPLIIILAGLLLGRAGVVLFTLIAIFYTFFIFYAEKYNLFTCCNHLIKPAGVVAIMVILGTTALIFDLLSRRLSTALAQTRRNEQALRESEAKLRLIYENAYDGISIYEELPNRSRRLIDCNERYAEIAGRPKEELLRIGNTSLIQKKVSPEMSLEEILRVRRENRPYHGLFSWIRPDGKENIIEYSAAPVQVGGRPWTIGLDRDITEHKQITEKLRENEALLKTIINQIPFDLWVCDAEGRYMMQNAISRDLAGDLIGKTIDDLEISPELRSVYKQKHLQALNGLTVREELEVLVKGQPRILESVQAPIRDGERVLGLIGMRIDITERVQAETRLRLHTAQLEALRQIGLELAAKLDLESLLQSIVTRAQALLNGHRGGIFLYRPDLQALEMVATSDPVSPIPLGILIKPGDGLTGQTWQRGQTIMTNDYPAWQEKSEAMTRLITSGVAPSGSIISTPVRGDNEILGVLNVTAKAKNHFSPADAELLNLFAAQAAVAIHNARLHEQSQAYAARLEQEVAERKRAEQALQEYSERLEERVTERTAELEQTIRQLQETQERLTRQEKLAVLGQLAGGVGHELRNPLGVINNALYFLNTILSDAGETVKDYLNLIADRVAEADKIVADLLNLSRTHAAAPQEVGISSLVAETLQRYPPPEAVTVIIPEGVELPPVLVDPQQIGQVLANLVINAYQAMPEGGTLTITTSALPNYVALTLADTGLGMSPEVMGKIFEPLYTTKAKGIGLGLAVSRNLVDVNGGAIEVESQEGQGATFTISLPISASKEKVI